MCNCNNHSSVCVFDMEVYEETGQTSGGVCLNCDGNTSGQQCELCTPLYYPRPDRVQTDPDICEGNWSMAVVLWQLFVIIIGGGFQSSPHIVYSQM